VTGYPRMWVTFETRFGLVKPAVAIDLDLEVTSLAERHLAGPARRELARTGPRWRYGQARPSGPPRTG
jgi:hypothetical protein